MFNNDSPLIVVFTGIFLFFSYIIGRFGDLIMYIFFLNASPVVKFCLHFSFNKYINMIFDSLK